IREIEDTDITRERLKEVETRFPIRFLDWDCKERDGFIDISPLGITVLKREYGALWLSWSEVPFYVFTFERIPVFHWNFIDHVSFVYHWPKDAQMNKRKTGMSVKGSATITWWARGYMRQIKKAIDIVLEERLKRRERLRLLTQERSL
ncbi:hypothetical protein PROFUN_00923, partial [Planoprotostelium fungivorum]